MHEKDHVPRGYGKMQNDFYNKLVQSIETASHSTNNNNKTADLLAAAKRENKIEINQNKRIYMSTNATTIWIDNDVKCEAIL